MSHRSVNSVSNLERLVAARVRQSPRAGSRATDAIVERRLEDGWDILQPQPYPSVPLPVHILEAAESAIREKINPPSRGLPEFRQAVAATLSSELSINIDPQTEVLATSGGMHALEVAFSTLLDEGDEVIVPSPCYFLEGIIEPRGGKLVYVPMREEDNYRWDFDRLEDKISRRSKCVFLNTPVNPTGYVLTADDLEAMARIAIKHDLLVVADESYDKLIYDGLKHLSIASLPEMQERTILIRSFTKSYAMPNWRVGYIVASANLVEHFTKVLEWMTLFGSYISQKVATAALTGSQDWLEGMASEFQVRRDLVYEGIKKINGLSCVKPLSGPFVFLNVSRLRGTCDAIADILLSEFGVSTVPGSYFHSGDHIRMAFGGEKAVLEEILERWRRAVERIGLDERKVLQPPINSMAN